MELDLDVLSAAIKRLLDSGVSAAKITKVSRVHNIKRIMDQEIDATANSWDKLHEAFPAQIPRPTRKDGSTFRVYIGRDATNTAGGNLNITTGANVPKEAEKLIALADLLGADESDWEAMTRLLTKRIAARDEQE